MRAFSFLVLFLSLIVPGCGALRNNIDQKTLACGSLEGDLQDLSWFQIQNEKAEILDLNLSPFSVVDSSLQPISRDSYRISPKGCLGVPQPQREFIVRIPGKKTLYTKLETTSQALQLLSVQSLEAPLKVNLSPSRLVYQGKTSVRVSFSGKSKSRFCLEELARAHCIQSSDLNAMLNSPDFKNFADSLELPSSEGQYRLHVLSEAEDGSLSLYPFDFSIDNTAPRVIPDFAERVVAVSYFGRPTYFLEPGYPIKFLSYNDSLAGTLIEYCVVPQKSPVNLCPNPQVYGHDNPQLVPRGASRLIYRALDLAGNVSLDGWQSASIMSRVRCKVSDFVHGVAASSPLSCHILEGDLDVNMLEPKNFSALDYLVEVTGRIQYASETATVVPLFQNLNAAHAIDINLGAELKSDFVSFPQLRQLRELNLRLSMGGRIIDAFNEIKQLLRVRLMNLENVKEFRIFRNLQIVDDVLWLAALGPATNVDFLSALTRAGQLRITNNDEIRDVKGLRRLSSVARLEITYSPKLTSLAGLESVIWVERLMLSGLGISDFTGLGNLKEITYGLWVESNPELVSVKGLDRLEKLSYFMFRDNVRLPAGTQLLGKTIEQ